jgi:alpha-2-macroglobulin
MRFGAICLAAALLAAPVLPAPLASAPAAAATLDQLQRADGVQVVPERFLRRWDPVTVFLDRDVGPAAGGPEDQPEKYATIAPAQAGAWQWLGARVLQFRPAEPWQPLRRVTVTVLGHATILVPLLPTPVETSPADEPDGIVDLDAVRLTFTDPVDERALARLLTIELRPQPGFAVGEAQQLTSQDFTIKALERAAPTDRQTYAVTLQRPLPDGYLAILRLRLSDEPGLDDPSFEFRLRSATPFTITDISCGGRFTRDTQDGVLRCTPPDPEDGKPRAAGPRELRLRFSAKPAELDIVHARNALRITPPVDDLAVARDKHNAYRITGRFLPDTVYELQVAPGSLQDERGRALSGAVAASRFAFIADRPALRWDAAQGIAERFGPQLVPLRGRGYDRADIRIYRIDATGRDFWPFPHDGIETEDDAPPPLAGNEPPPWSGPDEIRRRAIAARIRALGSPAVSDLVALPIARGGVEARFGLDLKPQFQKIAGSDQPGTYLVGLRTLDGSKRRWVRVQVTDLTLTTVEEADRVRFTVTSLATAKPIAGAEIRLEGARDDEFVTLARGVTGADGGFAWTAQEIPHVALRRIVVTKGTDILVLEPGRGPPQYEAENWSQPGTPWLGWAFDKVAERREGPRILCHVFTERPIYRPEEPVEISGFVRRYQQGGLAYATGSGTIVINGPGDQEWRLPVTLDAIGGFYQHWDQKTEATGDYTLRFEPKDGDSCGAIAFKKEAYKLPTFEVLLNGPQQVPLDGQFSVGLVARYFAGGLVADRPIKWRVTQFPYEWSPPGREGFLFSSDARFSGEHNFRSTPVLERDARTDAGGSAQITLDPTIEPTAQPRRYVVEATVTGDDDAQIRSTSHIAAVPPFVLGLKVPRYLAQLGAIEPDILAADADGKPIVGVAMTVRLIHRNWNSVLQASDFSQGSAKYVTQVIDDTVEERQIASTADVQHLHFDAREAGVYIVELEAADRIGRRQTLRVDLFMGGDTPVTWSQPPGQNVTVSTDKDAYAPGETATLVIQSPFQTARALAVVEEPEGRFRYDWVEIANGFGRYAVPIRKPQMPRLAVHFLVMRGRLLDAAAAPTAPFDQGKPVTVAATKWVTVTPVQHQVTVKLESPQTARPGQEIEVVLRLADADNYPVAGTAVFWMVDQAVLSLAKEQPLDPLPQFVINRPTRMAARDTRNMAFGLIPLQEAPGGEEAADEWGVENISVRRNFTPVPIYLPHVAVGPDGTAHIRVKLPDTLTVYKLRAKAVSGPDRFGFGTGELRVRQPVVAQPALPRFVRPGDQFDAGLIGRIVEGPEGAGRAALSADNLTVAAGKEQNLTWADKRPARVDFRVSVPQPPPGPQTARLRFLLQRNADKAGDAIEITLPIRPDRPPVRTHQIADLVPGQAIDLPPPTAPIRPQSFSAAVVLATDPALVRLIGGLDYLLRYPYGCTEQRISLTASELALQPFAPLLTMTGVAGRLAADVQATGRAIEQATDDDGLVAFWPHGKGSVLLTAWAYRFLVAADKAGQPVDKALTERLATVLTQALRSDYPRLMAGEQLRERVAALMALADGGKATDAYVAEIVRRVSQMPVESLAQAAEIVAQMPKPNPQMTQTLLDALWGRVRTLSRDGRLVYAGLVETGGSPLILPSETRSIAEVTQAVAMASPDEPRLQMLRDGLIGLGAGDGWGSTNANAAALRALAASWAPPARSVPVAVAFGDQRQTATLDHDQPLQRWTSDRAVPLHLENRGQQAITALSDTSYVPAEPGSAAAPIEHGLVLSRQLFRVPVQGPMQRLEPDGSGAIRLAVGDVIEETAELVNPEDRTHIALRLPLAAGLEPLNPNLATAPAEATASAPPSLPPSFVTFGDDEARYFWDQLPAGTYQVRFRLRATVAGTFTSPPGEAETMYRNDVYGASAGRQVTVAR